MQAFVSETTNWSWVRVHWDSCAAILVSFQYREFFYYDRCGVAGDPGVPNSWCWPNQNNSDLPQTAPHPYFPPLTFAKRSPINEGLCPVDDAVPAANSNQRSGGCPATDYAACTCKYNGTVPNNRDQPLLFDLQHDPVRCFWNLTNHTTPCAMCLTCGCTLFFMLRQTETTNLANDPAHQQTLAQLRAALDVRNSTRILVLC